MRSYMLLVLAAALATAAAAPTYEDNETSVSERDELEQWIAPFFTCSLLKVEELSSQLVTTLRQMKSIVWPQLTGEERTLLVNTADKYKPALLRYVDSSCALSNTLNREDMLLLGKVKELLSNRELSNKMKSDLMKKITLGDFDDGEILATKLTEVLRMTLNDEDVNMTEEEKTNYMRMVSQIMNISKVTYNELISLGKSSTLDEYVKITELLQKMKIIIHQQPEALIRHRY